jgi:hypothetical protein
MCAVVSQRKLISCKEDCLCSLKSNEMVLYFSLPEGKGFGEKERLIVWHQEWNGQQGVDANRRFYASHAYHNINFH